MNLIKNYTDALQAIYDHVGFTEDWVVCPIDDATNMYWETDGDTVRYAPTIEDFKDENSGNHYSDDVYKQRFYSKWIYEGEKFTMIFCNPHTDGMRFFRLFDNSKNIQDRAISKIRAIEVEKQKAALSAELIASWQLHTKVE